MPESGNMVTLATGETVDISNILANEGSKRADKLLVHKVEGVYVLIADGWKNVYTMFPKGEMADVDFVPLVGAANGASETKLRPGVASRCTLLTYKNAQGQEHKLYIGAEGKTSANDCPAKESSGT